VSNEHNPFIGRPPKEIPLRNAPLARVVAQVHFPRILSLEKAEFIGPFQEAIRNEYPVLRPEQIQGFIVSPLGVAQAAGPQTVWRFSDIAGKWRVSLAPDFLSLETTQYLSRGDFVLRLGAAVTALNACINPPVIDRLGIRYVDRVTGDTVKDIAKLVRPEICGIAQSLPSSQILQLLTHAVFEIDGCQMMARWGYIPPNASFDLNVLEAIAEPSWILDLDMFRASTQAFDVGSLVRDARSYSEKIYAFFRWAVTFEFLRRYGGEV
jgi:uncharacterized protein (TIGR04255 family)